MRVLLPSVCRISPAAPPGGRLEVAGDRVGERRDRVLVGHDAHAEAVLGGRRGRDRADGGDDHAVEQPGRGRPAPGARRSPRTVDELVNVTASIRARPRGAGGRRPAPSPARPSGTPAPPSPGRRAPRAPGAGRPALRRRGPAAPRPRGRAAGPSASTSPSARYSAGTTSASMPSAAEGLGGLGADRGHAAAGEAPRVEPGAPEPLAERRHAVDAREDDPPEGRERPDRLVEGRPVLGRADPDGGERDRLARRRPRGARSAGAAWAGVASPAPAARGADGARARLAAAGHHPGTTSKPTPRHRAPPPPPGTRPVPRDQPDHPAPGGRVGPQERRTHASAGIPPPSSPTRTRSAALGAPSITAVATSASATTTWAPVRACWARTASSPDPPGPVPMNVTSPFSRHPPLPG